MEGEVEQLAQADEQRIARRMRPVRQRIEPLDGADEEELVELPEAARQRQGARQHHRAQAGEGGERDPPGGGD